MRTLVFGAAGQVGREVRRAAWPRSFELLPLDKDDGDIADPAAVAAVVAEHRPNLVINLAAYTAVDRAESEPETAWAVNCDGAANIAAPDVNRLLVLPASYRNFCRTSLPNFLTNYGIVAATWVE